MATANSPSVTNTTVGTRDNRPRGLFILDSQALTDGSKRFIALEIHGAACKTIRWNQLRNHCKTYRTSLGRQSDGSTRRPHTQNEEETAVPLEACFAHDAASRNGKVETLLAATLPLRWWPVRPDLYSSHGVL